jgi:hypothetical protein
MHVPCLRDATAEFGTGGQAIALDHGHAREMVGQHAGSEQASHTAAHDDGLRGCRERASRIGDR